MKALQLTLILSMGLLLFAVAVLPKQWVAVACMGTLAAVFLVAKRRPVNVEQGKQRRWTRTALGMAIAIGFIVWALLANRHG